MCGQRDREGLHAKARAGLVTQFTGIPTETTPEEAAQEILLHLERPGYIGTGPDAG